jgi:hypothetical protein
MENLVKALVKAQMKMPDIKHNATGMHKATYTTLDHLIKETMPVLNNEGLAVIQTVKTTDTNSTQLVTLLLHESGESIASTMHFNPSPNPQEVGKQITYYRRYCYQSILGISTEKDDDGDGIAKNYSKQSAIGIDEIIESRLQAGEVVPDKFKPSEKQINFLRKFAGQMNEKEITALKNNLLQKTDCIALIEKYKGE